MGARMCSMEPDHDLHIHTYLSACCNDKAHQTPHNILQRAMDLGLNTIGFADHVWVHPELTPNSWYQSQDARQIENLRLDLGKEDFPLRILVGCEAETVAPGKFGITPDFAESLDFVLLACSHDPECLPSSRTPRAVADRLMCFFRSAVQSGLADAIPHPFFQPGYLEIYDATIAAISDEEFLDVFGMAARRGVALEITTAFLPPSKGGFPLRSEWTLDTPLRMLSLARQAGCHFIFGSDAHELGDMDRLPLLKYFIDKLSLEEEHLWLGGGRQG